MVVSTGSWTNFTIAALTTDADADYLNTNSTSYVEGRLRGFDFSIPGGATIEGIEITISLASSAGNATAYARARISKDAGSNWSAYDTEVSTTGSISHTFGSPTDKWGLTLSQSEVNDTTNFYVGLEGYETATNRQCRIEYLNVTVHVS